MSYVKREDVLGKVAISPDGNTFGTVKDIAFSTKGDVGLVVAKKGGSEVIVSIRQTSAIGEFILLSSVPEQGPAPSPLQPMPARQNPAPATCPSCGNPVKAGAKFCGKCGTGLS
jgi:sporulation protein YlmC with PRC-barrel domain